MSGLADDLREKARQAAADYQREVDAEPRVAAALWYGFRLGLAVGFVGGAVLVGVLWGLL